MECQQFIKDPDVEVLVLGYPKVFFSRAVNVQSDSLCAWNVQETNATLIFVDRLSSCEATKSNNLPQVTCTNNEYQNVANSTFLIEKSDLFNFKCLCKVL